MTKKDVDSNLRERKRVKEFRQADIYTYICVCTYVDVFFFLNHVNMKRQPPVCRLFMLINESSISDGLATGITVQ